MNSDRKIILYIACSLDGFITEKEDNLDFLSLVEDESEDYGYSNFINSVDTVLMGRKTFEWVYDKIGTVPHPNLETFVITRTPREKIGKTEFYTGDLVDLTTKLKTLNDKSIYCDGGAELVLSLLKIEAIDEVIISVIPILLGEGKKLFSPGYSKHKLKLISSQSFSKGLVQIHYQLIK